MDNDSATKLIEQYYKFLIFIWAVGNGHAHTLIKLPDPPDNDKTDSLLEKTQEKFKAGYDRQHRDSNMGDGEDKTDDDDQSAQS
jgi:hypothetical protein